MRRAINARRNGEPPLPRNFTKNPIGQVTRIKREQRRMRGALRDVQAWMLEEFDRIPRSEISANAAGFVINRYEYLISLPELDRIIGELARRLGDLPDDLLVEATVAAYRQGTGDEVVNLSAITSDYTREVSQVIQSDPWQRRVALMRSRVFEELRGFEGDTATDLARVLSQAVENGQNPMAVRSKLQERFGVSRSRAERIARTEIGQAYRRARLDEDADANERLGIKTGLLWISAFAPNSRQSHMALNGEIVDQDFVRDFYADGGNAINCMCGQTSVLLDDDGNVVTPGVVERVKRAAPATEGEPIANAKCGCA